MKIEGGGGAGPTSAPTRAASGPAPAFSPAGAQAGQGAAPASGLGRMGATPSLDALIALQESPGPTERKRRAVRRAGRLLDVLDQVKLTLLDGLAPDVALLNLASAVGDQRSETDDPALEGVLDEIETRAMVELAKAEVARANAA
jgi:hypothetical protein